MCIRDRVPRAHGEKLREGTPSDAMLVVKRIDVSIMTEAERAEAMNEVSVLASLANGNPFIIGYHYVSTTSRRPRVLHFCIAKAVF